MKSKNLLVVAFLCMPTVHSIYAMHKSDHEDYGRIPMDIELYRRDQWNNYREHGNPKNTDAIATHDHVVEAITLIHKPCDSLIQRHNYWEVKSEKEMKKESMEYVRLLKEDFDKREENFLKLSSRFDTYRSNFDDFVMAVGYKQLIEKRMEQEQKPDNFHYWQLRDYVRALGSRISAHQSWLYAVRRTGEEHYGFLHQWGYSRDLDESISRYRTDHPKVQKYCWEHFFKENLSGGFFEHWRFSYVSNREDNIARMLSPKSVATIQAVINRGYEDTTDDNDSDDSSDYESDDENEEVEPNNLLLGINGWRG